MSYLPPIGLDHPTTTEQLSGRSVDGSPTYVKMVKVAGALGTGAGAVTAAHGISGMTRLIWMHGAAHTTSSGDITVPRPSTSRAFAIDARIVGSNLVVDIGSSFTGAAALSDLWMVLEYLK